MLRLCLIVLSILLSLCFVSTNDNWEFAVALTNRIEFITKLGDLVDTFAVKDGDVMSLAYDPIRRQLYFANKKHPTFSIFQLDPVKKSVTPIVLKQTDGGSDSSLKGIAYDSVTQTLYWVYGSSIKYLTLNETSEPQDGHILHKFESSKPSALAIDICHGKLYWTTPRINLIQRCDLDGNNLINVTTTQEMPEGIIVDQYRQRVFWTEHGGVAIMYIKSLSILPNDSNHIPSVHIKADNFHEPKGLSVLKSRLFWTEYGGGTIYSSSINSTNKTPAVLKNYNRVRGSIIGDIVSISKESYLNPNECNSVLLYENKVDEEIFDQIDKINNLTYRTNITGENGGLCLNGGSEDSRGGCDCKNGFYGRNCEVSLCHNYCLHNGQCTIIDEEPKCDCAKEYKSNRCENDLCYGHCQNNGECTVVDGAPHCKCPEDYYGDQCEKHDIVRRSACVLHCALTAVGYDHGRLVNLSSSHEIAVLLSGLAPSCRCSDFVKEDLVSAWINDSRRNDGRTIVGSICDGSSNETRCQFGTLSVIAIIALAVLCLLFMALSTALITKVRSLRKRPRINKRFIVNKNVTPLTSRPQPTEQCEITIENCCNMNICETPCFEPEFRKPGETEKYKKEEKRNLLKSIDLPGDDLY